VIARKITKNVLGWSLSALLHVGVVTVALVGLPYLERPRPTPPPPIAIEFVVISNKTQQSAPKVEVEQEATEDKPQPKYAAAEQVPDVADNAVPLPDKIPPKELTPKPAPKPKPKLSEARKLAQQVRPRSKPKPPSRIKSTRIAALIDRSFKEEREAAKKVNEKKDEKKKNEEAKKPKVFAGGLQGRLATASIRDALSQKLAGCWVFPRGAKGVENMQILVRISLRPDGTLLRQPEFIKAGDLSDGFYRVYAESARRAVLGCAPYSDVAKILFDMGESSIDFNFSGAVFAGG